jgi:hypothetical protein
MSLIPWSKIKWVGAREMTQELRTHSFLAEDPSKVPTHIEQLTSACTSNPRESIQRHLLASASTCPLVLIAHTQAHTKSSRKVSVFNYVGSLSTPEGRWLWRPAALDPLELELPWLQRVKLLCFLTLTPGKSSAVILKNRQKTCPFIVDTECCVFSKKSIYLKLKLRVTQEILPLHLKCMS